MRTVSYTHLDVYKRQVPKEYPKQQDKTQPVIDALKALMRSKSEQENIVAGLPGKLAVAIEKSNHIMAEDIIREAGYMLPLSLIHI